MSTEDKTGESQTPSNNTDASKDEGRKSRPPSARRRRRSSRGGNKNKSTEKNADAESRQVEEQSLGPGRKKRIFKRRRPAGEQEETSDSNSQTTDSKDGSRRTKRSRSGSKGRNRNGSEEGASSDRGPRRSRNRSDSSRNDGSRNRGREDDRSRKRTGSGRERNQPDISARVEVEAPDGTFNEDLYSDLENYSGSRPANDLFEDVPSGDVTFFSSKQGQDFASMEAEDIDFLKPHDADENEMYVDMPTLDVSLKVKGELTDIVGVKTHRSGTIDPFDCENLILQKGDEVIVETDRGLAIGEVMVPTTRRYVSREVPRVFRIASKNDMRQRERNLQKAAEAFELCQKSISQLKLVMKLVEVMYLHGGNKAVFYFMAEGRVDFRQLVKDLAKDLHIRVEMRQIGVRDASRMIGGLGTCGHVLCCSRYIREFAPVSIRMAKDQDLVLNPEKVSGQCGRLMCCLSYEEEVYKENGKKMPRVGKIVDTPEGSGRVRDRDILRGLVRVELETEHGLKTFEITDIRPLKNTNDGNRGREPQDGNDNQNRPKSRRNRKEDPSMANNDSGSESGPQSSDAAAENDNGTPTDNHS
ncbi:MAG: hypothetical protein JXX29_18715 [Deltaproteobacteria bacterium]|nr:hypothetical protein [Deltaproteobacteria bacterium]MBN2673719.1 hypothetical protein [Deltaproteobacteria bacterium]